MNDGLVILALVITKAHLQKTQMLKDEQPTKMITALMCLLLCGQRLAVSTRC